MSYPYLPLISLLKFRTSVNEYSRITSFYTLPETVTLTRAVKNDYWDMLPLYFCAQCPICGAQREEMIDTYSLAGWLGLSRELRDRIYVWPKQQFPMESCPHFMTYHRFLNLHDRVPVETSYFSNNVGEAPLITLWALPADLEAYAVLHALPICRIEEDQFVPNATLFILSYFNQDPEFVVQRHYAAEWEYGKGDREFFPSSLTPPNPDKSADPLYDLQSWAEQGRLGYLDFTQPALPLRIGQGTQLPAIYRAIEGERREYTWRKGEMITSVNGRKTVLKTVK